MSPTVWEQAYSRDLELRVAPPFVLSLSGGGDGGSSGSKTPARRSVPYAVRAFYSENRNHIQGPPSFGFRVDPPAARINGGWSRLVS